MGHLSDLTRGIVVIPAGCPADCLRQQAVGVGGNVQVLRPAAGRVAGRMANLDQVAVEVIGVMLQVAAQGSRVRRRIGVNTAGILCSGRQVLSFVLPPAGGYQPVEGIVVIIAFRGNAAVGKKDGLAGQIPDAGDVADRVVGVSQILQHVARRQGADAAHQAPGQRIVGRDGCDAVGVQDPAALALFVVFGLFDQRFFRQARDRSGDRADPAQQVIAKRLAAAVRDRLLEHPVLRVVTG